MTNGPETPVLWYSKVRAVAASPVPLPRPAMTEVGMILTALVLFCCNTLTVDTPRVPEAPVAVESKTASTAEPTAASESGKPDAPMPKPEILSRVEIEPGSGGGAATPSGAPILNSPVKPATPESYETERQRKIWYGLVFLGHGAAVFDAWTTRRAVSGGYGVEGDPLQRPFANTGAIYATTQVTPLILDYVGHRMIRSSHSWIRHSWWVPQAAGASLSLGAGLHNYGIAH